jgi:ectoine hydroxylase-related dioxygenase (phytanoyl-CoA dioxygenase family)
MSVEVSLQCVKEFRERGVTVLRNVFRDWLSALQTGVDKNMADPGPFVRRYTEEGQPGLFFGDYCNWQRIAEYRQFVFDSPAGSVAAALMESRRVRFFHEHVLVKEPGTTEATPWHHDQPYYSIDGSQHCSLWIPLDTVPKASCPEFIASSHQWGKWYTPTRFTGENWDRKKQREGLEQIPDIDAHRDEYDILSWDLDAGDAIAFNFLTVHGAPPNRSASQRRRGFSARLIGDDACWAVRTGETSPPFPELKGKLEHGASLEGLEQFPVIFQAG